STVASHIAGDLAAPGRVADQHDVAQVELIDDGGQVVGVGVQVVAFPRLAGTAVAAPIVGHSTEPVGGDVPHLVIPGVGGQRPSVAEHDGLPAAPVLVEDLGAVLGGNHTGAHGLTPLL